MGVDVWTGWLFGQRNGRLSDLIRASSNVSWSEKPEQLGNALVLKVEVVTGKATIIAWLDPSVEYQPRRIEIEDHSKEGNVTQFVAQNFKYERIEDHMVGVAVDTMWSSSISKYESKSSHERTIVKFGPPNDANAFKLEAPSGYAIQNNDQPGLPWKVVDGEFLTSCG